MNHSPAQLLKALEDDRATRTALAQTPVAALQVGLLLMLESLRGWLDALYSGQGRPARDPVAMLRTLLVMMACHETSLNQWPDRLKNNAVLRAASGFGPEDGVPGVGTLYDFIGRVLDGPVPTNKKAKRSWVRRSKQLRKRRHRRDLAAEKSARTSQTVAEMLAPAKARLKALQEGAGLLGTFADRMNHLLRFAVQESIARGLIGLDGRVVLSVDGSLIASRANKRGRRCALDLNIESEETRAYWAPEATLGRKDKGKPWVFGHKITLMSAKQGKTELPIALDVAPAHVADNIMAPAALAAGVWAVDGLKVEAMPADKGYDASALYRFCQSLDIHPVIKPKIEVVANDDVPRDANGHPLCPGNLPMRSHGRQGDRLVFCCPIRRPNGKGQVVDHLDECPNRALCDPDSKMGPYVRLDAVGSPRANLQVYPDSKRWKAWYAQRTAVERLFSRLKEEGKLGARPYARQYIYHFMATCQSVVMHVRAWAAAGHLEAPKTVRDLHAFVDRAEALAAR